MQAQKEIILLIVASTFLFFILISFIVTILFLNKKQQNGFYKEVESIKSNFEKELLKTQLEIQEETFQHISLELHDNVSHFLSLAKLHLTTLKLPMPEEVIKKMEAAAVLIAYSLDEIRNISKNLNTDNIKSNGLIKTVEQQVEQLQRSGMFAINFTITGKTCYLEDQKEIVLFRILQESLNNIVRHSKANLIQIKLQYDEQKLLLSVQDNGVGFKFNHFIQNTNHNSSGLKNIIKRTSLINATHEILSNPGEGTTINITIPYV